MKKFLLILLTFVSSLANATNFAPDGDDKTLRDSIFKMADSIEPAQKKAQYLRAQVLAHIGKPWTTEVLDSVIVLSQKYNEKEEELQAIFDYARHYQFLQEKDKFRHYLEILKERCYKYERYGLYLSAWMGDMQYYTSSGNIEYVIMESKKMEEEMRRVGYEKGIYAIKLVLGQALSMAEKKEEAIEVYLTTLNDNIMNINGKMRLHLRLMGLYLDTNDYKNALKHLSEREKILETEIENTPDNEKAKFNTARIETYLGYSSIYAELDDKDNLKKYLLKAKEYITPTSFYNFLINYHSNWGSYYQMTKDWDNCFREFDLALSRFNDSEPKHKLSILKLKKDALIEADRKEEAANLYSYNLLKKDSLNHSISTKNEELLRANFEIKEALVIKERNSLYRYLVESIITLILIAGLMMSVYRALKLHRKLIKSETETRKALALTESADQLKANFLRNITYEVRIPLNSVVGFSDILSTDKDLSQVEREEYSHLIKKNSDKLLSLINNILDLSRLESGMMSFNKEKCNAIQLCNEAKMTAEMRNGNPLSIKFTTNDIDVPIFIDSRWFVRVLTSLLVNTSPCSSDKAECTVNVENNKLVIIVSNIKNKDDKDDEQNRRITHTINKLFIKQLNGTYLLFDDNHHIKTSITLPLISK